MALLVAALVGCTAVPLGSGPPEDGGPDTDSGIPFHPTHPPEKDRLPGWSLRWAKTASGHLRTEVSSLAATGPDTFVAGGHLMQSGDGPAEILFDAFAVPATTDNAFWVKYSVDGKALWATWAGDNLSTLVFNLDSDESGRFASCGWCPGGERFGPGEPNETVVLSGHPDAWGPTSYFAVFEADGSLAWVRSFLVPAQASGSECLSVELLEDGSVLAAGAFRFGAVAGAGTAKETILLQHPAVEATDQNFYLAKYDPDGELIWARREGGPGATRHIAVTALADGSFFLSGVFKGTTVLGEDQTNETALVSAGEGSVFLARYDSQADLDWAIDLGIDGNSSFTTPTSKPLPLDGGDVAIHGRFRGSIPAGDGDALSPVISEESGGVFLSRYTEAGEHVWTRVATRIGGLGFGSTISDTTELHDGALVISGHFSGSLTLGAGESTQTVLDAMGGDRIPISSWPPTRPRATSCGLCNRRASTTARSGASFVCLWE
jgi:hypothetical protein